MRALRLLLRPALLCIVAGCSNNTTGTTGNNVAPPQPNPTSDIGILPGASLPPYNAFNPNSKSASLAAGGGTVTIRWINGDISGNDYQTGTAVAHQITSSDNPAAFAMSKVLGGNATYTITLSAQGTYNYHCNIHPNMVGTITVTP